MAQPAQPTHPPAQPPQQPQQAQQPPQPGPAITDQHLLAQGLAPEHIAQLQAMGMTASGFFGQLVKLAPILIQLLQGLQQAAGQPGQPAPPPAPGA
jgi:hypothetical protein